MAFYICDGFGVTMAQFFSDGEMVELTPELKEKFDRARFTGRIG